MIRVLAVCSSPFHIEIAKALDARAGGAFETVIGASPDLGYPDVTPLSAWVGARGRIGRRIAERHSMGAARAMLQETRVDAVVVGNDVAPIEKAITHVARSVDVPVVHLQDGLFPAWRSPSWRLPAARLARGIGSTMIAPTLYGAGEATHVGTLGRSWMEPLMARRTHACVAMHAVGNVAFASTLREARSLTQTEWCRRVGVDRRPLAVFFTTNLLGGLGTTDRARHQRQAQRVAAAAAAFARIGWIMRVRLHPAETPTDYRGLVDPGLLLDPAMPLSAALGAADVGLVSGSVVALLVAALGRPVAWAATYGATSEERAAAQWLGIDLLEEPVDLVARRPTIDSSRLRSLLVDDDDDPGGSRSVRLVREAAGLK